MRENSLVNAGLPRVCQTRGCARPVKYSTKESVLRNSRVYIYTRSSGGIGRSKYDGTRALPGRTIGVFTRARAMARLWPHVYICLRPRRICSGRQYRRRMRHTSLIASAPRAVAPEAEDFASLLSVIYTLFLRLVRTYVCMCVIHARARAAKV